MNAEILRPVKVAPVVVSDNLGGEWAGGSVRSLDIWSANHLRFSYSSHNEMDHAVNARNAIPTSGYESVPSEAEPISEIHLRKMC